MTGWYFCSVSIIAVHCGRTLKAFAVPSSRHFLKARRMVRCAQPFEGHHLRADEFGACRGQPVESGIAVADDIRRMRRAGLHAFLIGESLMKQKDVAIATHNLMKVF